MYRRFAMAVLACALLAGGLQQAMAESTVDIVVVGYINHGPMQPTVDAIRNVTSGYDGRVNVSWLDMATADGQKYMAEHGLDAHLNIVIDGRYQYAIDNRTVTFQWFEGQQWTKDDLDAVISDLLSGEGNAVAQSPADPGTPIVQVLAALAICAAAGGSYLIYRKKRAV